MSENHRGLLERLAEKIGVIDIAIVLTLITEIPATIYFTLVGILKPEQYMIVLTATLFLVYAALFKKNSGA